MKKFNPITLLFRSSRWKVTGAAVFIIALIALALINISLKVQLSPQLDLSSTDITLKHRASDHKTDGGLLQNRIEGFTDTPDYGTSTDDPAELLDKNSQGNIDTLFRIHGEIDYR